MKVGFFPGCSLEGSSREYDESLRAIAPLLGLESTTKITGFLRRLIGFSFQNDSFTARPTSSGSNKGRARTNRFGTSVVKSSIRGGVTVVVAMD